MLYFNDIIQRTYKQVFFSWLSWCTNYLIPDGKNNRYGHPNDGVLENLKDSKIYRTDQDGSVMFKINNSGFNIKTFAP